MPALDLLGPVVLGGSAGAVALSVKKAQALLVLLALGGPMPRARVVALLWPQLDESTGRRNLRRELARLREVGAAHAVAADGDRLALADAVSCDVRAFGSALRQGEPDRALALWRGPPADGLVLDDAQGFGDWLAIERERLLAARRRALEASAAAHEARGDLEAALQRIESLLADDALQEQHHRDAMRLHAACGRREAALAQYRQCCRLLKEELDLQPMAETEALAAALRGAPSAGPAAALPSPRVPMTAPAAAAPAALLPTQMPFVGRSNEVANLETAWRAGRALLIEGEAGVGKTRLACDFAAAHGPYALVRCRPSDTAVPYAAFTRALRMLVGPTPELSSLAPWVRDELARLLPEVGAVPAPMRSPAEHSRFIEACTQTWLALAADSFDAVILDDWHHADSASQALLGNIAQRRQEQGGVGAREMLVYRSELSTPASQALQSLRNDAQGHHLRLGPLAADAVLALVQQLSGAQDPQRFAARLGHATAGNPFFLAETLRHLTELKLLAADADGVWQTPFDDATDDYRELPMPASVHETVLARVRRMSAATQRVLEAAALAGEPFVPALLAPACALSEAETVLAIEQAMAARQLREHDDGGYAFAHDLVQQALEASLTPERRRLVHRRLALGAEAMPAAPAVIAAHHEASGDVQRAVAFRITAGRQADHLHARAEAVAHWQRGLADRPTPSQELLLRSELLSALKHLGARDEGDAQASALGELADGGTLSPSERIDALIERADYLAFGQGAAAAVAILDALPLGLDEGQQLRAAQARVMALRDLGRVDEATLLCRQTLALPALQGRARAAMLDQGVRAEQLADRFHAALELTAEALAISKALGDEVGIARGHQRRGVFYVELGDLVQAELELWLSVRLCARIGLLSMQRASLYNLCCLYSAQDRPADVLAAAQQCWSIQPPMQRSELRVMVHLGFVDALLALGDLGQAWERASAAAADALAVGAPIGLTNTLMTCVDLFGLLGEQAIVHRLLAALDESMLRQMPQTAGEMWIGLAQAALREGDAEAGQRWLGRIDGDTLPSNPRVALRLQITRGQLAWLRGEAGRALALLPPLDAPGMNGMLRAQALVVRLDAEGAEGADAALQPATLRALHEELAQPPTHAASALELHRAWSRALAAGLPGLPPVLPAPRAGLLAQLTDSLRAHPVQRESFLQRNA